MTASSSYPPIAEHGLVGDLQTTALVRSDGTIDYFCCPRIDSPTVFGSLLDGERGGQFRVTAIGDDVVTKQMYLPDTAILVTRYLAETGVAEVTDFMPIEEPGTATDRRRLVRVLRGVRGRVELDVLVQPRFDYGRQEHLTKLEGQHATFTSDDLVLDLTATVALDDDDGDVRARITLDEGDIACFVLESGADGAPTEIGGGEVLRLYDDTYRYWHDWVEGGTYRGRWREMVYRSAITLKLLTFAPSGAIVAAATGGLPEQVGGERNWDYRYTWVRDGSFSVRSLVALGFHDEAIAFSEWMRDRVEEKREDGSTPLNIMYRVDGSSDLVEETLDHFEGYRGSRPVRVGNGAATQLQLDIYGELLDSVYVLDQSGVITGDEGWGDIAEVVDWVCENWDQPDEGVWETRGGRQPFVYGRLMCWVALDRAIRIALNRSLPAPIEKWRTERDRIYRVIHDKGWNDQLKAFVQYEGSDVLDASVLLMPLTGFASPLDPKWIATLEAVDRTLVSDSLVYRYDPKASPDGLRGSEGTFSICTFWYVAALARTGRVEEARLTFEKMLTYANHLGLFSEEIGATGDQLGNFPQAFTHLSLVLAAIELDELLDP
jgi:GH15 family glucan-1,4-alpha-glucosidase